MTTRLNKKLIAALLALGGAMALAGCDEIEARPTDDETEVLVNEDGSKTDVYDNIKSVLYDAVTGSKNDRVLSQFMEIVGNDLFGKYSELKAPATEEARAAYAEAHKKIFCKDSDEALATKFNTTVAKIRAGRVEAFQEEVEKRINETFYNEIKSGSYSDDNKVFYEERLAMAHFASLYDIDVVTPGQTWYEGYLTPELDKYDVSEFIHLERYEDYIERHIIPTVYKDKLVEEYLFENNYPIFGRSYARKVNIVKLSRDDEHKDVARKVVNSYVSQYIYDAEATAERLSFDGLGNAWKGFKGLNANGSIIPLDAQEEAVLTGAGYTKVATPVEIEAIDGTTQDFYYFKETKIGLLLEKYKLITPEQEANRYAPTEVSEAISTFTGSNAHTKEVGLRLKLAELAAEDYTTDGWYVKNGGLTDLPSAIRDRLFNIIVSNNVDYFDAADMETKDSHTYDKSKFVRYINNHYYLTPAISDPDGLYNFVIYNEGDFYLVEVEEAPITSKLSVDNAKGYTTIRAEEGALFTESVAHEIAKVLGTKDSYINNAYASYIKEYSLAYHDQSIYDYFKSKFPELFEDD